jgi:hypothetical protein
VSHASALVPYMYSVVANASSVHVYIGASHTCLRVRVGAYPVHLCWVGRCMDENLDSWMEDDGSRTIQNQGNVTNHGQVDVCFLNFTAVRH